MKNYCCMCIPVVFMLIFFGCQSQEGSMNSGGGAIGGKTSNFECGDYAVNHSDSNLYVLDEADFSHFDDDENSVQIIRYANAFGENLKMLKFAFSRKNLQIPVEKGDVFRYVIQKGDRTLVDRTFYIDVTRKRFGYLVMDEKESGFSLVCNDTTYIDNSGKMLLLVTGYPYPVDFKNSSIDDNGNGCIWMARQDQKRYLQLLWSEGLIVALRI